MLSGEGKVAIQHRKWGYYAKVSIVIDLTNLFEGIRAKFDQEFANNWENGALFGIEYAWEKIIEVKKEYIGVSVNIMEIHGHEVDTTLITVAYAAMYAFWNAVNEWPKIYPKIKKESGIFLIPK